MGFEALTKPLLLYLCLCLVTAIFSPSLVLNDNTPLGLFNLQYNETSGEITTTSGFNDTSLNQELDINPTDTSSSNIFKTGVDWVTDQFQRVVDGLANVMNVLKILFKFLFCPFIIFGSELFIGAPFIIKLLIPIPLVYITFMGILAVIRNG